MFLASAALTALVIGAAVVVGWVALTLYLLWRPWGAVIPFVAWAASALALLTSPIQEFIARAVLGCREVDADPVNEVWQSVRRRVGGAPDYTLVMIDSEGLCACSGLGRIIAVTSTSASSLPSGQLEAVLAHELGHRHGQRAWMDVATAQAMLPVWGLRWCLRALWKPVVPMWRRAVEWHRPIGFLLTFLLLSAAALVSVAVAVPVALASLAKRTAALASRTKDADADAFAVSLGLGVPLLAAVEGHLDAIHARGGRLDSALAGRATRIRRALMTPVQNAQESGS
jgi:Zn-dependent protease with chaperone function